jgi:hypothetical protein
MKVLDNPLLSRNFSFTGLKLNDKGLYYVNKKDFKDINAPVHEIFITSDPVKILSIMELDFEQVDKANNDEFIEILIDCPYFNRNRFLDDISEGRCKLLEEMSEFLQNTDFDPNYKKTTLMRIMDFFGNEGNLMDKLEKSKKIFEFNKIPAKNLSGKLILEHVPDYDKTKLSSTIPKFLHDTFEDEIERDYFLVTKTALEIVDYFLETTESKFAE